MSRITVRRVREAFKKKPYYPISGVFRDSDGGLCPVCCVLKNEAGRTFLTSQRPHSVAPINQMADALGVSIAYLYSFLDGYDLEDFDPGRHLKTGYSDGFRVRNHIPPLKDYNH